MCENCMMGEKYFIFFKGNIFCPSLNGKTGILDPETIAAEFSFPAFWLTLSLSSQSQMLFAYFVFDSVFWSKDQFLLHIRFPTQAFVEHVPRWAALICWKSGGKFGRKFGGKCQKAEAVCRPHGSWPLYLQVVCIVGVCGCCLLPCYASGWVLTT